MTFRAIDLFCGAGGSSWGVRDAGARMVGAVDAWDVAARTYKDNFPSAQVVCATLREGSRARTLPNVGRVDLIIASPECTHHSIARGAKPLDEKSRRSGWSILPFIRAMEPRWVVLENVPRMRSWLGFADMIAKIERYGYKLRMQVLDAADFGVPQTRRRLFIIGDRLRQPAEILIPRRKQRTATSILDPVGKWKAERVFNGRRATATIARIKTGIRAMGRGKDFLTVYYSSDRAGGWQRLDRPLRTLTTLDRFGLVQWIDGEPTLRMLQIPELKRAMGLPGTFSLGHGNRRDKIKLLGNGVCAPVMRQIVASLINGDVQLQAAE
jgi:DNA (cytosine-5)-methyltransferase 1